MIYGLSIIKHDFDTMENHNPHHHEVVATFADDVNGKNAFTKAGDWLRDQKDKLYLGWDQRVYPTYEIKQIEIK